MFTRFARPDQFHRLTTWVLPLFSILAAVCLSYGLYQALYLSPADYQQGDAVRIMYVHVPCAWLGLFIYASAGVAALIALVWRHRLAEFYMDAAVPLGALFTALCLITGSLWGQPIWGTWWVWDARLTSVLVLFMQYLGYLALRHGFDDEQRSLQAGAVLLLIGLINIPIIKFSVEWWNTLHQPASISRLGKPTMDSSMLKPLLLMAGGFFALYGCLVILRLKTLMLQARQQTKLLRQIWATS
jgi:heme exporter protein C